MEGRVREDHVEGRPRVQGGVHVRVDGRAGQAARGQGRLGAADTGQVAVHQGHGRAAPRGPRTDQAGAAAQVQHVLPVQRAAVRVEAFQRAQHQRGGLVGFRGAEHAGQAHDGHAEGLEALGVREGRGGAGAADEFRHAHPTVTRHDLPRTEGVPGQPDVAVEALVTVPGDVQRPAGRRAGVRPGDLRGGVRVPAVPGQHQRHGPGAVRPALQQGLAGHRRVRVQATRRQGAQRGGAALHGAQRHARQAAQQATHGAQVQYVAAHAVLAHHARQQRLRGVHVRVPAHATLGEGLQGIQSGREVRGAHLEVVHGGPRLRTAPGHGRRAIGGGSLGGSVVLESDLLLGPARHPHRVAHRDAIQATRPPNGPPRPGARGPSGDRETRPPRHRRGRACPALLQSVGVHFTTMLMMRPGT